MLDGLGRQRIDAVSYTHLDVYKRQLESKAEDALAGAAVEAEHGKGVIGNFAGYFFEGSGVQSFLIAEVVIEEGLVYPCGGGNGAGSSTGEAMFAEFACLLYTSRCV